MARRRDVLVGMTAGAFFAGSAWLQRSAAAATAEPALNDDGLHVQPWFVQSFLELRDDLEEASAQGKRLAVVWEQKGCPYCREMHRVNFARDDISNYVREHFAVIQLNLWGSREVTDFDGVAMEERELARRWRVNFTPTICFFPTSLEALEGRAGGDIEVARMPGYFKPFHFLSMFEFVAAEAYRTQNFQRFLQDKFAEYEARGIDPNVW